MGKLDNMRRRQIGQNNATMAGIVQANKLSSSKPKHIQENAGA